MLLKKLCILHNSCSSPHSLVTLRHMDSSAFPMPQAREVFLLTSAGVVLAYNSFMFHLLIKKKKVVLLNRTKVQGRLYNKEH